MNLHGSGAKSRTRLEELRPRRRIGHAAPGWDGPEWGPPPGPHIALTHAELRRGDAFSADPDPALAAVDVDEVVAATDRLLPES